MHAVAVELDEGQDYPQAGYTEIIETMKASKWKQWRIHGVSRGVRDQFYKFTMNEDPNLHFKVHQYAAVYRDTWSDKERQSKIALYGGSEENIDYRRNVFGEHGSATSTLFVLHRLSQCVAMSRTAEEIDYNENVYTMTRISESLLDAAGKGIIEMLEPNTRHLDGKYVAYFAGMDIGFSKDPTELLLWGNYTDDEGNNRYDQLLRIQMHRISTHDQAAVVRWLFDQYGDRLKAVCLDRNGVGLGLMQVLADEHTQPSLPAHVRERIIGYVGHQKLPVAIEDRQMEAGETLADLAIKQTVTSWGFSKLRELVDQQLIRLPNDQEQLAEFQGQKILTQRDPVSGKYVQLSGSGRHSYHTLDAAILLVAGMELPGLEKMLAPKPQEPVLDLFG